jgi:hypothetical protein
VRIGVAWLPATASVAAASGTAAGSISRCGRGQSTVHHSAVSAAERVPARGVVSASGSLTGAESG